MRESLLVGIAVTAAFLGFALGRLLMPQRAPAVTARTDQVVSPDAKPLSSRQEGQALAPEVVVDPNSTPEAIRAWRREEKEALEARVEKLSNDQVEYLCFALQLIPRDEVFDKINVKRRLIRHIDSMRIAAEFADVETAFRGLDERR